MKKVVFAGYLVMLVVDLVAQSNGLVSTGGEQANVARRNGDNSEGCIVKIGGRDDFESVYMAKFRSLAAPYGVFVEYERDRAGRDIGLHLTQPNREGDGKIVTPALVWFQMKGIMTDTLSLKEYQAMDDVPVDLDTSHLRFWYINVQPTYLAVYVESADQFLAIDVKDWVSQNYGEAIMTLPQKTVRVRVGKRNPIDSEFFRLVLNKNLLPSLRQAFAQDDDRKIVRFLRDSSVVKWLANCTLSKTKARLTVVNYMSKMRTEVYFENQADSGEWERFRAHWQFMMGGIAAAFPYLVFDPERKAVKSGHSIFIVDNEDSDEFEDEELDSECLLPVSDDVYSYGEMLSGEFIIHHIRIGLNEIGERWAATLNVLEEAEVITVGVEPHFISVAPWHERDV